MVLLTVGWSVVRRHAGQLVVAGVCATVMISYGMLGYVVVLCRLAGQLRSWVLVQTRTFMTSSISTSMRSRRRKQGQPGDQTQTGNVDTTITLILRDTLLFIGIIDYEYHWFVIFTDYHYHHWAVRGSDPDTLGGQHDHVRQKFVSIPLGSSMGTRG